MCVCVCISLSTLVRLVCLAWFTDGSLLDGVVVMAWFWFVSVVSVVVLLVGCVWGGAGFV